MENKDEGTVVGRMVFVSSGGDWKIKRNKGG
jgi:hypothetical protein